MAIPKKQPAAPAVDGKMAMPIATVIDGPQTARPLSAKATSSAIPVATLPVADAAIAVRAHELYCRRGKVDGHDKEDWATARRDLTTDALAK